MVCPVCGYCPVCGHRALAGLWPLESVWLTSDGNLRHSNIICTTGGGMLPPDKES
jgi:hypothetical protein